MITVERATKSYPSKNGRVTILDELSCVFEPGKNTALIGKNGAGKSTLMRLLSGSETPDSGKIIRQGSVSWPLGFKGGLHGSLSGKENIGFISRIYGKDFKEVFDYVTQFAELGNYMLEDVKTYSNGMKARLSFGISMAFDFDYYLIDEIIAVGDAEFRRKCKKVLNEKMEKSTVILVSHSNSMMRDFCEYGVVIKNGKISEVKKINKAIAYYENNEVEHIQT
jgi:capsular polysaccharide transport system ATP-binding protein